MLHAILGQTRQWPRGSGVTALVPAAVAVAILANPTVPMPEGVDKTKSTAPSTLNRINPVPAAHASISDSSELSLESTEDPALASVLIEEELSDTAQIIELDAEPAMQPLDAAEAEALRSPGTPVELKVRRGDALSSLLSGAGVRNADWLALAKLGGIASKLNRLHPGDVLRLRLEGSELLRLELALDEMTTLVVERQEDQGFSQHVLERPHRLEQRHASGEIQDSLYLSALQMGLTDRMIMQLANIFAWDIDFERDVRTGDRLVVLYEQPVDSRNGQDVGDAEVLAATYIQARKSFEAVYYAPSKGEPGYFNAEGRPMKKAFLRTPVEFSRISSRFSKGRKHPILNTIRAHRGVDYAAGHGTPIRATGDGRVVHAGTKGGYGRTVIIEHGGKYRTLYAHMSRYGHAIGAGTRVRQGQIIGYVGSSGLATGPHLHYEFHVHGNHVDPLSVKLPAADPLPKDQIAAFHAHAHPLLAQLATLAEPTSVAQAGQ